MGEFEENVESPEVEKSNSTSEEPTKSYAGWVTASAFAAISTLFGVLWQVQTKSYNNARDDYREAKLEAKLQRKSDSIVNESLRLEIKNCDDNAIEELEKKMRQVDRLKNAAIMDYSKVDRELELSKKNAETIVKATIDVKKAIKKVSKN